MTDHLSTKPPLGPWRVLEDCKCELCVHYREHELRQAFLNDLTQLSLRYKLVISGCGCCGSPSINTMSDDPRHKVMPGGHYVFTDQLEWKNPVDPEPMVDHPLRHKYCGTDQVCAKCSQPFDHHQ